MEVVMSLNECNNSTISMDYIPIIQKLGQKWRNNSKNPVNDPMFSNIINEWEIFIKNWASDPNIPLLIRKKDGELGIINIHNTGRKLVPVDNSPAQWVFACVCNGFSPPNNVVNDLNNGLVPIAMVLPKLKLGVEAYRGALNKCPNTQTLGWYLGHKNDVGLNKKILDCSITELQSHFIKLMSPSNMFVVPKDKKMRGLAELIDFIKQQ
jgi:hypothetical protein